MKILVLNYEFPPLGGGGGEVSLELAKRYIQLGHTVDVVTAGFKGLQDHEEIVPGLNIYRVRCLRSREKVSYPHEQISYLFAGFTQAKKLVTKEKYDICHTHFLVPTGILARWVKRRFGLQYIVTSHGSDVPGHNEERFTLLHKFTRPILKKVIRDSRKVVAPSKYLKGLMLEKIDKDLAEKITYIPNGIDTEIFHPTEKKNIILSTGRLIEGKGFHHLIKAVSNEDLGFELHIAGDGPMMDELKRLAAQSKTKVVFHGWIDNTGETYKKLLSSAAIYCLLSSKENASISLLEAMSSGCAMITSNVSGCAETVGDAGITVQPGDVDTLSQELRRIVQDSQKREELQQKARSRVESVYSWSTVRDAYQKLIQS